MTRRLAIVRVLLGMLFLFRTSALSRLAPGIHAPVVGPLLGWPDAGLHGWALPAAIAIGLALLRTAAALAFAVGFRARPAGLVAAGAGLVALALDPWGFTFTLELLFVAVAVVAFASPRAPVSSVRTVRLLAASIYFWSAIPKLRSAWWSGDVLAAYHAAAVVHGRAADFFLGAHPQATAVATLAVELALGPLLLWRRTRTGAVLLACMLHTILELTLHPDVLGWLMMILLVAFWPDPLTSSRRRLGKGGALGSDFSKINLLIF